MPSSVTTAEWILGLLVLVLTTPCDSFFKKRN